MNDVPDSRDEELFRWLVIIFKYFYTIPPLKEIATVEDVRIVCKYCGQKFPATKDVKLTDLEAHGKRCAKILGQGEE